MSGAQHDNGCTHKNVTVSHLTSFVLGVEFDEPKGKRAYCRRNRGGGELSVSKQTLIIDAWLTQFTSRGRITSRDGYMVYKKRIIPPLSKDQQQKYFEFASDLRDNWGLMEVASVC